MMKRYLSILLAALMLLAAGCTKEETPQPQEVQLQPESLWRAEDGAYLGIFSNGFIMAFDETSVKQGQWSEEDECVTAVFEDGASQGEYFAEETSVTYEHDGQGRLQAQGRTYEHVTDADAFRDAAAQIDVYQHSGAAAWMSQIEMNMGYAVTYHLWEGLEQLLFDEVVQTVEEPEVWQEDEQTWKQQREEAMEAAGAEFSGGSAASMAASSCGISWTVERVWMMLDLLDA